MLSVATLKPKITRCLCQVIWVRSALLLPGGIRSMGGHTRKRHAFFGRKVISISGDGGLGQYLADLTTPIKYHMNITHVVMHNRELGKISKETKVSRITGMGKRHY